MLPDPANKPADIEAQDGEVRVEGPGGIQYSFTPDAAIETSDRMLEGGMAAKGQLLKKKLADPRRRGRDGGFDGLG